MSSTTEQALDASDYIYQGLWMNWSKSRVLGPTITLSPASATLLTNILALFVTIAGGQAWTVLRFTLHQLRTLSSRSKCSARYNKEQVVLRNATSAIAAAQLLVYLGWSNRKQVAHSETKLAITPVVVLAILTTAFFLLAGAFSNTVTNAGSAVLSRSPYCGFWNQTYANIVYSLALESPENFDLFDESIAYLDHDVGLSLQYAQSCYLMQGTGSSNCDTFKKSSLELTTSEDGTCPFDSTMCQSNTLVFDTGFIDSHEDLGINSRISDRIKYRRVTNCTVLNDTAYTTDWINQTAVSPEQPTWRIAYADFGPDVEYGNNFTYSYSNSADFNTAYAAQYILPYSLGMDMAYALCDIWNPSASSFSPIPELKQDKADFFLLYLSFAGTYMTPVDDPWFAAHDMTHINTTVPFLQTTYARDRPISTVGCTEQHQFCTDSMNCTPLLGLDQVTLYLTNNYVLTPTQNITLERVLQSAGYSNTYAIVPGLTYASVGMPLLAIDKRVAGNKKTVSLPLPDDQWKLELQNWQFISMAQLQRFIVEYGTGQISPQPKYLLPPNTTSEKWICQNLMIKSTVYSSFSVLALSLVLLVGLMVVILSLTIESLTAWISRKYGRWEHARETWIDHDMLGDQLWRLKNHTVTPDKQDHWETYAGDGELPSYLQIHSLPEVGDDKKLRRACRVVAGTFARGS